ncbi:MAG: SpoIIE family protein phosphatase [Melioribacteraceae bacterium]|nr:SpoIIE family protein phosphatase [Melioribacteraceae bacterium]
MKHILIAEDQQAARFVFTFQLKKVGFKVTSVENGALALKAIQENLDSDNQIDFLVTDIEMPEMSGLDLYKKLIDLEIEIPTIVMTAYGTKHVVVELMRMGCSEYLDKPFPPEELINRINQIVAEDEKQKKKKSKLEDDRNRFELELNSYKRSSEKLREQVNSAKNAYENIIKIEKKNLNVNLSYKIEPLADLGGDFFSIKNTETGCDILLADVAGHDMGSSFHTILIKSVFEDNVKLMRNGNDFFTKLNRRLIDESENNRLVTAVFIRVNLEEMKAEITSAGHPYTVFLGKDSDKPNQIAVLGDILGILDEVSFETSTIKIKSKDRILLYTDGIEDHGYINSETGKKIKLKDSGLIKLACENRELELEPFVDKTWNSILEFGKYNAKDDMTFATIEIK